MRNPAYAAFSALDPFFDIVRQGLAGLVDGDHYFDTIALDAVFEFWYRFPGDAQCPLWHEKLGEWAVSADGSTVCVLILRLNSSCRRSIALVVRRRCAPTLAVGWLRLHRVH